MTGYGQEGPLSARAGHDINYIAVSGALWPIGRAGESPVPPLNLVGDFGGGALFLVVGVLAAVIAARSSGEGQVVDAAMVDGSASLMTMITALMNAGFWHRGARGQSLGHRARTFYEVYETKDSRYVAVGAIEAKFYDALARRSRARARRASRPDGPRAVARDEGALRASSLAKRRATSGPRSSQGVDACVTPVLSPREAARTPTTRRASVFSSDGDVSPSRRRGSPRRPLAIGRSPGRPVQGRARDSQLGDRAKSESRRCAPRARSVRY